VLTLTWIGRPSVLRCALRVEGPKTKAPQRSEITEGLYLDDCHRSPEAPTQGPPYPRNYFHKLEESSL
jgi:hypothetical protein